MRTYYFGNIEFGEFVKGNDHYPVALIQRVDDVRQFQNDAEADEYREYQGFDSYLDVNCKMEMYFSRKA